MQYCLRPKDDEEFDFFPGSFLWYQLFIIVLISLILIKFISISSMYNLSESVSMGMIKFHSNYSIFDNSSFYNNSNNGEYPITFIDWVIIYGIFILNNWESLFAFYRYYSTRQTMTSLELVERKTIFKLFICRYSFTFGLLYTLQIHLYYWLFPLIILLQSTFSIFCTWKTSEILIFQFKEMHKS